MVWAAVTFKISLKVSILRLTDGGARVRVPEIGKMYFIILLKSSLTTQYLIKSTEQVT